jgi:AcrR family transcriptional regulator
VARRLPRGTETRERILEAALEQFADRGYTAVSVDDVARAAGVTKGAVYYWFADKDDLGRDLQQDLYDRLTTASLHALDPEGDAVTNMRRAFHVYLDELGSLGRARFFLRDAWTIPELDPGSRRVQDDATAVVRGVLAGAIARGEVVPLDPDALARVLMGAWAEATLHVLTTGHREPTVAVVEHLVESLRYSTTDTTDTGERRRSRTKRSRNP